MPLDGRLALGVAHDAERGVLERALTGSLGGRFRLGQLRGAGGMGVVWDAEDTAVGERVALKTLARVDPRALLRFKNEFRAMRDVHHPNLVRLGELFDAGGTWFFTMELVEGNDLLAHFRGDARPTAEASTITAALPRGRAGPAPVLPCELDFAEVRAVFAQLAAGLVALHEHQRIHRDVKPGNVRVTPAGRAVLLDFGLVAESSVEASIDQGLMGTLSYMAPEQASGGAVGPAADWYAFGATLYEVLCGRVPIDGPALQVIVDKQRVTPPSARTIDPSIPADLDQLCDALLAFDPRHRPTGPEVLRRLGDLRAAARPSTSSAGPLFVGRSQELAALRDAFDEVSREGGALTALVHGESGIGKTALVTQFANEARASDALVLRGRCYERESLPYKALDGVVDSLASALQRMSPADAAASLPLHASLLLRLFPVLGRVEAFRRAPETRAASDDPLERRRRAFGALRELFTRVAARRRVAVVIDDLHWSDADGVELLRALVSPPEPPPIVLVVSSREAHVSEGGSWPTPVRAIALGPLDERAAAELAAGLLGASDETIATSLVRETQGHPLLLAELARYTATHARGVASLADAVTESVASLSGEARAVLELVALAAAPVSQRALSRATGIPLGDVGRLIGSLRVARLVRTDRELDVDLVECIHDRVRAAIVGAIGDEPRRDLHGSLATALESEPGVDVEAVARHHELAGDLARAVVFWERGATSARETLAFERASTLYRRILEHDAGATPDRRRALQRLLAESLVGSGRGREAAAAYVSASEGSNAAERIELRRIAAGHLMRSGHIEEGMALLRDVLASVGLEMPRGGAIGLLPALWNRLVIGWCGYRFKWRDESEVPRRALMLVDALGATVESTTLLESVAGMRLHARYLRAALAAGEPHRVARALFAEVVHMGLVGSPAEATVARALAAAKAIVDRLKDPRLEAAYAGVVALATYQRGDFAESLPLFDVAIEQLRSAGPGLYWEIAILQTFRLFALSWQGKYGEIERTFYALLRDADERGDVWAGSVLRLGLGGATLMLVLPVAEARRHIEAAIVPWRRHTFGFPHFLHALGCAAAALCDGDSAGALARLDAAEGPMRRALLLHSQMLRVILWRDRIFTLLVLRTPAALREAARLVARMRREPVSYSQVYATYLTGLIAMHRGRKREAIEALDRAIRRSDDTGLANVKALAVYARGRAVGGEEGDRARADARTQLEAMGVINVDLALRHFGAA